MPSKIAYVSVLCDRWLCFCLILVVIAYIFLWLAHYSWWDGWCSSVGRASDRHASVAGSIPWCGKGFFSQSPLSVQTLTVSMHPYVQPHTLTSVLMFKIRQSMSVWWIMETLEHPACTIGLVVRLCRSQLSQQDEFPMGEISKGQYGCKMKKNKAMFSLTLILY